MNKGAINRGIALLLALAVLLLLSPYRADAAITLVQTAKANGGGYVNSYNIAFGSNVASGSLLIAVVTSGSDGTPTVTDSRSNTWAKAVTVSNARKTEIWYALNASAGATTVTVTFGSGQYQDGGTIIREYSGIATASALDVTATGSSGASWVISHTSSAVSSTQANALLVAASGADAGAAGWAAGTNYGNLATQDGFDPWTGMAIEDRIVSATGSYSASFSTTEYVQSQTALAIFKEASGGGTPAAKFEEIIIFD